MTTERTLNAIIGLAESLEAHWPTYQATEAALAPALLNAATTTPGGRTSDHADPTANRATALTADLKIIDGRITIDSYPDTCHALDQALRWLRLAQQRQGWVIRQHPDVAREADATLRALRCDGSIDPLCTRNAVKGGLCWACLKRRQRADDDALDYPTPSPMVDMSTPNLLNVSPVSPPATSTVAECGRCGWTTPALDIEHAKLLLEEHHATDCPA